MAEAPKNLIDATDEELAAALHTLDGHSDGFEGEEARAWRIIRGMLLRTVGQERELMADNIALERQLTA